MKILWCWRCRMDIPMLEAHEWKVIAKAHNGKSNSDPSIAFGILEQEAERLGIAPPIPPPEDTPAIAKFLWHLIAGYHMFTGILEESPNPIWHHVVSVHGPPCNECGKPLRTSKSSMCAACGASVSD